VFSESTAPDKEQIMSTNDKAQTLDSDFRQPVNQLITYYRQQSQNT
jgi:hypothetical protein